MSFYDNIFLAPPEPDERPDEPWDGDYSHNGYDYIVTNGEITDIEPTPNPLTFGLMDALYEHAISETIKEMKRIDKENKYDACFD